MSCASSSSSTETTRWADVARKSSMCSLLNTGTASSPVRSVRKIVSPLDVRCSRNTSAAGVRKVSVIVTGGPPPSPWTSVEGHRVLGVVEQRQPEAHADAAARRVDRERGRRLDGHLVGVDLGERLRRRHDQPGAGCRGRRGRIDLHRRRRAVPARRSRPRPRARPRRAPPTTIAKVATNARPRRRRARAARVGASVLIRVLGLVDRLDRRRVDLEAAVGGRADRSGDRDPLPRLEGGTDAATGMLAGCASITQCVITSRVRSNAPPEPSAGVTKPVSVTVSPSNASGFVAVANTVAHSPTPNDDVSPVAARVTASAPANSGGAPTSRDIASSADSEVGGSTRVSSTTPHAATPPSTVAASAAGWAGWAWASDESARGRRISRSILRRLARFCDARMPQPGRRA